MSDTITTGPPAFERDVVATVADLEDQQSQMLDQIYDNRSHHTTQHQMLEATVHYLEQEFIDKLGIMFLCFRQNDNQIRAIHNRMTIFSNQIQTVQTTFSNKMQAVQALAGHIPGLKNQLTKIKDTLESTVRQVKLSKIDSGEMYDQISSVKHDMATIKELEYLKGELDELVNRVGCIQDTIDDPMGTDRIEFQAEERAIYLERFTENGGVHEYRAEESGQVAISDNPTNLAWQLRSLKGRVTRLEDNSSSYLRNQVNATVQGQQVLQSDFHQLQGDHERLQTDHQRLQARVAALLTAVISLNPNLASLHISEPSPDSSSFSCGPTAVTTPCPPNNNGVLSTEGALDFEQPTESPSAETDTVRCNFTLEISHSNYQSPTVEDFAEVDHSPTINRSAPKTLNPRAAPFVYTPSRTHAYNTSSYIAPSTAFEMDSSKNNNGPNKPNGKKPYNDGKGLEDSIWHPKNKQALRQAQACRARATSNRTASRSGSSTRGGHGVNVVPTATTAAPPPASAQQGQYNEADDEWFNAFASPAQPFIEENLNQGQVTVTEDNNQLIPGLEEIAAAPVAGSVTEQLAIAADSLLDDNGDVYNVSIPVLPYQVPLSPNTEEDTNQPAEVSLTQRTQGLSVESAGSSESGTHEGAAGEITGSTSAGAGNDQDQGIEASAPVVGEVAANEDAPTMITFYRAKIRVQAGKTGPFVIVGHLDQEAFDLMSVKLVITIEKAQPMKIKVVATIKGGEHDGEDAGVAVFIIPIFIHRSTFQLDSHLAATENQLSSAALLEFNAVKAAAGGLITGNIHRVTFEYTPPNVTNNMEKASGDTALAAKLFTDLNDWSGGKVSFLFLDEANDSQLVGEVLGELERQIKG